MQDDGRVWTPEEQAYCLAFDRMSGSGVGLARLKLIWDQEGTFGPLWRANAEQLRQYKGFTPEVIEAFMRLRQGVDPEKVLKETEKLGIRAYPYFHPEYPFRLRDIHDPPLVVYLKGGLHPDQMPHICAVIGTRNPSPYGVRLAKEFGRDLGSSGVVVVSGMAIGIDALAHWGAIEGGGKTLAILACGADVCYPSSNRPLYKKLVEDANCGVLTEFPPGTKAEPWRFPARNRIISGLSQAVAVIEAGEGSGSLITATLAFEQNRELFAVPGRVDSIHSKGTNGLIARDMAHLCRDYEDILREMNWVASASANNVPTVVELFGREREIFDLVSPEPVHFDSLCEQSGIPAPELSATLTMLELAGIVERMPGDWYSRTRVRVAK